MFQKNMKKSNFKVFAMMILVMDLSACTFGAEKTGMADAMPSVKEEGLFDGKEVVALTAGLETQIDTELSKENSGLGDKEQNQSGELQSVPGEEVETSKEFEISGDEPEQPEEGQQEKESVQTWQSAYLEVIYHLWDYLAPRYEPRSHKDSRREYNNPENLWSFYLGLHDFDGDGTLELITGDGLGVAIFTYENGHVKKIADLCPLDPAATWCVCGMHFKDNSIRVECDGSGGANVINFGYIDGEYMLGYYNEQTSTDPITINGREVTVEEVGRIYTLDYDKIEEEECRERFRLVNEKGVWILKHYESDEESVLDMSFDFDSVLW